MVSLMFLSYFSSYFFPSFLRSSPLSFSFFPSVFLLGTSSSLSHPLFCMSSWAGLQASLQVTALNIPTSVSCKYFGLIQDWLCSSPLLACHPSSLPEQHSTPRASSLFLLNQSDHVPPPLAHRLNLNSWWSQEQLHDLRLPAFPACWKVSMFGENMTLP